MANKKLTPRTDSRPSRHWHSMAVKAGLVLTYVYSKAWFRVLVLWLVAYAVLLSFYFSTILENHNYLEIVPGELVLPFVMHAITALLIALVCFAVKAVRLFAAKLVTVIALALSLQGFDGNLRVVAGPIRALIPGMAADDPLAYAAVVYLALLVLVAVIIGLLAQRMLAKLQRLRPHDVHFGMLVLIGFLFVTPLFSFLDIVPDMISQARVQAPVLGSGGKPAQSKPDIYYIVLDRYANADVLERQFNYSNSSFTGFLRDNDFTVNDNAYANYPYTAISMASTMNADYLDKLVAPYKDSRVQSRALFHNNVWQSPTVKALKQQGYSYHQVGSWYGLSYRAPLADRQYVSVHTVKFFGLSKTLRGIEVSEFHKSPYYRFAQLSNISWWPFQTVSLEHVDIVKQQLQALRAITTEQPPGGRFIFAHILVPHDPFIFKADGSLSNDSTADNVGRPIKQKYTEQVTFINGQMELLVSNIMKQSKGKAVVVLNADEGPYPWVMNGDFTQAGGEPMGADTVDQNQDMRQWSDDWLRMKFGILQAVHIPNATENDMAKISSVNVFRIILNRYFGYQLEYLPNCHYGVSNGTQNLFNFSDVTERLTGQTTTYCKQHQSLSVDARK